MHPELLARRAEEVFCPMDFLKNLSHDKKHEIEQKLVIRNDLGKILWQKRKSHNSYYCIGSYNGYISIDLVNLKKLPVSEKCYIIYLIANALREDDLSSGCFIYNTAGESERRHFDAIVRSVYHENHQKFLK